MVKFKVKIEGLDRVIKQIEAYDKKLGDDVSAELEKGAQFASEKAKQLAPNGESGRLKSSIGFASIDKYNKMFFASAPYAAYVEFGTGSRVFESKSGFAFTPEMREFAREFYVNGMGRMPATPFMFPALEIAKLEIIKNVRSLLLKGII